MAKGSDALIQQTGSLRAANEVNVPAPFTKNRIDMGACLQLVMSLPPKPEERTEQQERLYRRCWEEIERLLFPEEPAL